MKNVISCSIKNVGSFMTTLTIVFILLFVASCSKDDDGSGTDDGPLAAAQTDTISQNIDERTVLKNLGTGIDYYFCGGISVSNALIIEPGVNIMMCAESGIYIKETGSINAVGTAEAPISIVGEVASAGYWNYIGIESNNPDNVFEYVHVKNGGGDSYPIDYASVFVNDGAQLTLNNSSISNGKKYGLLVDRGGLLPGFTSNTFSHNGDAGIKIPFSIIGSLDAASNYMDGNEKNYIHVYSEDLNQDQTVKVTDAPYYIEGVSNINGGLTMSPGVTFLMGPRSGLFVRSTGYFNAIGTSADKITIKGAVASIGYWDYIDFDSNNPKNEFAYVEISNGGADSYPVDYATIFVNEGRAFTMHNCSISDSYGWGIYVNDGAIISPVDVSGMLAANTFSGNGNGADANCSGSCDVRID